MIYNLILENNLRGYGFEYMVKILLRRQHKHNFIFQLCQFDSIQEIITKYRLRLPYTFAEFRNEAMLNWNKCDLIEFVLDSKFNRNVLRIVCYDVKTKHVNAEKPFFEVCHSNHEFMTKISQFGVSTQIASVVIFENWKFSLNLFDYSKARIRVFSNFKKPKLDQSIGKSKVESDGRVKGES
jgi:hypothetical protein